jgi:MerR family transcriptional regulator/heat shock protein HspR
MRRNNDFPTYLISEVAKILNIHPQTLRSYERKGLIKPKRIGNQRYYSNRDIEKLKFIKELSNSGVGKAGIDIIIEMQSRIQKLEEEIFELKRRNALLKGELISFRKNLPVVKIEETIVFKEHKDK